MAQDLKHLARTPANPAVCRIEGMDISILPWWVFLIICPLLFLGVAFVSWRWRKGGGLIRLLRDGKVAWGERVAKERTNVRINNRVQWKYTFRFEDDLGRSHEVIARTTHTHLLEDDAREAILYAPHMPSLAMVVDTEARLLRVDERGAWRAPGARVIGLLIAPAISVALMVTTALVF